MTSLATAAIEKDVSPLTTAYSSTNESRKRGRDDDESDTSIKSNPDTSTLTSVLIDNATAGSQHHPSKKRRTANIIKLTELQLDTTAIFGSYSKSKMCGLVPITTCDARPLLVQFSGGGTIPRAFGLEKREQGERYSLSFSIENSAEQKALERLRTDLGGCIVEKWPQWFPESKQVSAELLRDYCNVFVTVPKTKREGNGEWPGLSKVTIDAAMVETRACRIVDPGTGDYISMDELPGMSWVRMILEFKYVYIQATKAYGITRILRYIECVGGTEHDDIVPLA
jgi:hypothetical protein